MAVVQQAAPVRFRVRHLPATAPLAIGITVALAAMIGTILYFILLLCGGHLIYSLDDPYISLALGWNIGHGHYGLNPGEAASPSSSILYPFVLALFAWAPWQDWAPLIVNALAAIGTGILFGAALVRYGIIGEGRYRVRGALFVILLCVSINTVGLVFDGLEHSLHAMTSVFVVFALARALETEEIRPSLLVGIVLLPLWRFEGAALALLAIAALAATRHWRAALVALASMAALIGAYMLAMHGLGLPLLPSSVLTKSKIAQHAVDTPLGVLAPIVNNAVASLREAAIPVFLLLALIIARPIKRMLRPHKKPDRLSLYRELVFAATVAGALIAHVLFGDWEWFARYEAYAVAFGAAGAIVLWRGAIGWLLQRRNPIYDLLAAAAIVMIGQTYVIVTLVTPIAAEGIYEQQYQLHRFLEDDYRHPVAVNDLGLSSYRNPNYVLDLWGLGSEAARQARFAREPGWMDRLVQARHIGLAIIFDEWFAGQVPPEWRRLAVLHTLKRPTLASQNVVFYATSPEAVGPAMTALRAFQADLLPTTSLDLLQPGPATAP